GHKTDIVEGENAWIQIAMKKKYTNLTSCTAVRTSLAFEEPFPAVSVSEDCHTWLRYGAHPGKFVFLREIKGGYRICSGTQSRSRSLNADFYERLFLTDSDGFERR
ncbi:MAG: glycosyltransferase family 2 protein, partial [Clostridia bacterium]|nr:glycosyltransferase family 2 protein [Clostridia bacterium]